MRKRWSKLNEELTTYDVEYRDIWFFLSGISWRRDIRVFSEEEKDTILSDIQSRKKWLVVWNTKFKTKEIVQFWWRKRKEVYTKEAYEKIKEWKPQIL